VAKPLNNKYMSVGKYISNCPFHTTSVACTTTTAKKGYSKPHDTEHPTRMHKQEKHNSMNVKDSS